MFHACWQWYQQCVKGTFERHLQSEREMLKHVFIFNHQNYARYCSYQHLFLRSLEQKNSPAFLDLKEKGFGASITGDLVTELFNKEMKSVAGPFRRGFSTNSTSVNIWVRTMHIQSRLLRSFKKVVAYKTKSMHD